jgi:hypothetical protein
MRTSISKLFPTTSEGALGVVFTQIYRGAAYSAVVALGTVAVVPPNG